MSDSEDDLSKGLDHQEPTRSHPAPPPAALQPNGRHSSEPPETQTKTQTGYQHSNNMASPQADGTQANGTQPQNQIRTQPDSISQQLPPSRQKSPVEEAPIDPKQPLEAFGWDDLEERFLRKMEECQKGEEELEKEFRGWCEVSCSSSLFSLAVSVPLFPRSVKYIQSILSFLLHRLLQCLYLSLFLQSLGCGARLTGCGLL